MAEKPANTSRCEGDAAGKVKTRYRRHAAGEDPAKRGQILKGAMQCFMENGFDATSMNEVCREAGVSKGTLYVYFTDKVDLFEALVAEERDRMFEGIEALLKQDLPLREKLVLFGRLMVEVLCSDRVIRSQRIVAGIVERMPEVGARFYDVAARRNNASLAELLERESTAGRVDIPDIDLAASQFSELVCAGVWRARLFGKRETPPSAAEIETLVQSAVAMFLSAYEKRAG